MITRHGAVVVLLLLTQLVAAAALAGCRREQAPTAIVPTGEDPAPEPLLLPDLSAASDAVRQQVVRLADAAEKPSADESADARAAVYVDLGKLLLAAEYTDAAAAAFRRATIWAPSDPRWYYLLGHAHRNANRPVEAASAFERATALTPGGDFESLMWLGELYLDQGDPARAAEGFARAAALRDVAAVRAGLGRVALAGKNYATAVQHLERALMLEPRASSLHYPLALAYRGLGDTQRSSFHLRRRGDVEVSRSDERLRALGGLVESAPAHDAEGRSALARGDWTLAETHLRRGLELAGGDTRLRATLHHRLGTALAQQGDRGGAVAQFERAVEVLGSYAPAHYSLGLMAGSAGRLEQAGRHLATAVEHDRGYVEAHIALGDVHRFLGRFDNARTQYEQALDMAPLSAGARYGEAVSLVRLGQFTRARVRLEEAVRLLPNDPAFAVALARILAGAPDAAVRDGVRAVKLVQPLVQTLPTPDVFEAMAMALAELGSYPEAVRWQREAVAASERSAHRDRAAHLRRRVRMYEEGRPNRTPWTEEPVYEPFLR